MICFVLFLKDRCRYHTFLGRPSSAALSCRPASCLRSEFGPPGVRFNNSYMSRSSIMAYVGWTDVSCCLRSLARHDRRRQVAKDKPEPKEEEPET
jgi:hypothetical protein